MVFVQIKRGRHAQYTTTMRTLNATNAGCRSEEMEYCTLRGLSNHFAFQPTPRCAGQLRIHHDCILVRIRVKVLICVHVDIHVHVHLISNDVF